MVPQFVPGAGNLEWRAVIGGCRFGGELEVSKSIERPTSLPLTESEHEMNFDRIDTGALQPVQYHSCFTILSPLE